MISVFIWKDVIVHLHELVEIDTKRRKDLTKSEQLKAKRNDVSKQIAEKKRNKEDASDFAKKYSVEVFTHE